MTSQSRLYELKKENVTLQETLCTCQSQLDECQEQLENANRKASDTGKSTQELEQIKLLKLQGDHRIKELEEKLLQVQEDTMILKSRKDDLNRMPEIERENRRLKEENQYYKDKAENVLLLKEKTTSLQRKLERCEKRLADLPVIELENEEMKKRIVKWENCFKTAGVNKQCPEELSKMIMELQSGQSLLLEKQGHLQSSSQILEQSIHRLEQDGKTYKEKLNQEREKTAGQLDLIKRLQRKLLLVTKERDAFREIIQTYENEVTLSITSPLTAHRKQPNMKELDNMMTGYQKQVNSLEAELEKVRAQSMQDKTTIQQLEDRVNSSERHNESMATVTSVAEADQKIILNLREKVAQLEKSLAVISEEKEVLEARIEQRNLQGDYDPTKTKVLHFSMNPAAKAQKVRSEELKKLREENEKLKKRISVLEESGGTAVDVTARVDEKMEGETKPSKELEDAKAQLISAELKTKRLIEAFQQTSQQLREGCLQLTGYRIDMPVPSQYKLMNLYADSADDYLQFQRSSDGELKLLETAYSASLTDLVDMYLSQGNSIPAFLSALTLELFKKQTLLM